MEKEEAKAIIEAILFAAGKEVSEQELSMALEKPKEEIRREQFLWHFLIR